MPMTPANKEIDELLERDRQELDARINENLSEESNIPSTDKAEQTGDNPPEKAPEKAPTPKQRRTPDGISHAYDDIGLDELNKKSAPKKKEEKSSGWGLTPPKIDKKKTDLGKETNIMELIWKEFILASYAGTIDFVVDNTLDFVEYVLYAPFKSDKKVKIEKEPEGPKTIYAMGDEVFKKRREELEKGKNKFNESYVELKENLAREANGEKPKWTVWKSEPSFYQELKAIAEKAKANPESAEAKVMEEFNKVPEMIESLFKKEVGLFKLALNLATLETTANPISLLSPEAVEKLKSLKEMAENKDQGLDYQVVENTIKEIQSTIVEDDKTSKAILEELDKMKQASKKQATGKKQIIASLKKIRKIDGAAGSDEDVIKAHILRLSKEKYNRITQNIDKIHESYKDNPEERASVVKEYMTHIITSLTAAKPVVDAMITGDIKSKIPGYRSKAKEAVNKADQSIDDFKLKEENIGNVGAAAVHIENPFESKDKDAFIRNVRDYTMGMER